MPSAKSRTSFSAFPPHGKLHTPLQERIEAYEKRIEELEQDLAAKGEENRELIGARINVAKQQLKAERGRFGTN